jgi:hypothetical protein
VEIATLFKIFKTIKGKDLNIREKFFDFLNLMAEIILFYK